MQGFQDLIAGWGHLGVFVGIIATGLGFPMPEELPIVLGGAMATSGKVYVWTMLPVCIVGVIVGDSFLYLIGRFWGTKIVELPFVRKRLLPPERLAKISANFQEYGVKILLFARLTPGIRAPIFLTAGITKLPITHFLLADGIYAIPGVSLLFFLGYWFTDTIIELIEAESRYVKPIIVLVVLVGVVLYFVYEFWKKPMVTGNPTDMPPIVGPVTERLEGVAESLTDKMLHRSKFPGDDKKPEEVDAFNRKVKDEVAKNGQVHPSDDKKAEEESDPKKKADEKDAAQKKAEDELGRNGQVHPSPDEMKLAHPKDKTTDGSQ